MEEKKQSIQRGEYRIDFDWQTGEWIVSFRSTPATFKQLIFQVNFSTGKCPVKQLENLKPDKAED